MRKRFPGEMTVLGGFEMTSQTMRVSDPCTIVMSGAAVLSVSARPAHGRLAS